MNPLYYIVIFGFIFSAASCSQKSIQLDTILNANQCGFSQQKLVIIRSEKQLKQLFNQAFNNPIKSLGGIDFKTSNLVLISMGQQPTTGYSIQLNNLVATIDDSTLRIDAVLKTPATHQFNAQLITSPCALYKIEKNNINSIKLIK